MTLKVEVLKNCLYHDGVDDYTVITPFTVYGWREITIAEWIYPYWPKANSTWSKFSMIGDFWVDYPSTFLGPNNRTDYTELCIYWTTRRPGGTIRYYIYNFFAYRNTWVHVVRRFTENREISFWVNDVKTYSATVPADEKTVLEWNPDTATYPERYRRFVLGANVLFGEWMKVSYKSLRIYNRALSGNEIKILYNGGDVRDGLVLYLPMDEGSGNVVYDHSGYNNHGTIYGATWSQVWWDVTGRVTSLRRKISSRQLETLECEVIYHG